MSPQMLPYSNIYEIMFIKENCSSSVYEIMFINENLLNVWVWVRNILLIRNGWNILVGVINWNMQNISH